MIEELKSGTVYVAKKSDGGLIAWKFKQEHKSGGIGFRGRKYTRYHGVNMDTGREIVLKSKRKIIREMLLQK